MVLAWDLTKCHVLRCNRDGRVGGLVSTGTLAIANPILPAWMIVSNV